MVPGDYSPGFDNGMVPPKSGRVLAVSDANGTTSGTTVAPPSKTAQAKSGADRFIVGLLPIAAAMML